MNILETIRLHKLKEVKYKKERHPVQVLKASPYFFTRPVSLRESLMNPSSNGIIAEFKRKSPSRGDINLFADVRSVTTGYVRAGASALSVLTDEKFFGARADDLSTARKFNTCPILRKDFVVDEYQIFEAKSMGADAVLLIARILSASEAKSLANVAHGLGLEVLLEVHSKEEIVSHAGAGYDLVGINNRNLDSFRVNTEHSLELAPLLSPESVKVAESGLNSAGVIHQLKNAGFRGFLIGEFFMVSNDPAAKCRELIKQLE